ncbi:hypothetical protein JYU34_018291 [Plutella xylostella]|uniref:Uncharacterized protein n=1 Tax=Plutella xylostella TaxID=51655 RepID=A0ABQ7Q108_PLUXY|nr:hypothetical protein JYU34_018291 [Plutella xylostella]
MKSSGPAHQRTCRQTLVHRARPDVLDIVLHHLMPWPVHVEVMYDADTQHVPLLITVGINSEFRIQRPPRRTVDWAACRSASVLLRRATHDAR